MGTFVALLVDDERLKELAKSFEYYGYEPPPLLHVTIVFLGDVSGIYLHRLVATLTEKVFVAPKRLRIVGYDLLPPGKETNIALLVDEPRLVELRNEILDIVKPVKEDRFEYRPHLTIARRARAPDRETTERIVKLLENLWRTGRIPRTVACRELAVVQSIRGTYRVLSKLRTVD